MQCSDVVQESEVMQWWRTGGVQGKRVERGGRRIFIIAKVLSFLFRSDLSL